MVPAMKQKLLLFVVFILTTVLTLHAQRDTASLEGRAVDSGGAVVPLASVDAVNLDTNFDYHIVSDSAGQWTISPVRIGRYPVALTAPGFKAAVVGPITLDVQQRQRVDLTLVPGAVSQSVEVRSNAPLIQTDTSELGQVVDNKTMVGLPLNGRNPVQLAQLTVGVTTNEPGARTTSIRLSSVTPGSSRLCKELGWWRGKPSGACTGNGVNGGPYQACCCTSMAAATSGFRMSAGTT
jgi:hypothetical protein